MSIHSYHHQTSFGDCDPAGIVYYPNICKWLDATFHDWIRGHGGHASLCARLGAMGLGLMDVHVKFRAPIRDGDRLAVTITKVDWRERSLSVHYQVAHGDRICAEGTETRGVFLVRDGRMTAGNTGPLQDILSGDG
ncbi:acyl-CoA thioesterase [Cribrihabitans sp. XS_ASV171]